jgi:hypothetical protein
LARSQPADHTLQNLLYALTTKLELCSKLPIFEYEASSEGHEACARAFEELAATERTTFDTLLQTLHRHLDATAAAAAESPTRQPRRRR